MSDAIENLKAAQQRGMAGRPKIGGFPYLAETLSKGRHNTKPLVFARVPKCLLNRNGPGDSSGDAIDRRHGRCATV
jgi:hypothetical protein